MISGIARSLTLIDWKLTDISSKASVIPGLHRALLRNFREALGCSGAREVLLAPFPPPEHRPRFSPNSCSSLPFPVTLCPTILSYSLTSLTREPELYAAMTVYFLCLCVASTPPPDPSRVEYTHLAGQPFSFPEPSVYSSLPPEGKGGGGEEASSPPILIVVQCFNSTFPRTVRLTLMRCAASAILRNLSFL